MAKTMLWEAPTFQLTRYLEANYERILTEARQLAVEDYAEWPQSAGYVGGWRIYPIYARDPNWHLAPNCASHAARCPETAKIARRFGGVAMIGFSMFLPGTHVAPHRDGVDSKQDLLRCHMGIMVNDKSGMRIDGKTVQWQHGRCIVFDGQAEHEAANFGPTPRVILMVDIDRAALLGEGSAAEG